jgi:hypothetical protein
LAQEEERAAPAPRSACRDEKTGELVDCNSPHTLVMVLVGMSCMLALISVALGLFCWSVVTQRRQRREQAANPTTLAQAGTIPVDSPEYNDAVLVQLPGDEKPQFFALPKPFSVDGEKDVDKSPVVAVEDKAIREKEADSDPPDAPPDDRPGV